MILTVINLLLLGEFITDMIFHRFQIYFCLSQQTRPEKQLSSLASGPPPPAAIVPRATADGPKPPDWNGQPRRHGSSRFNVHNHNQELVKLPPIKGKFLR